MVSGNGDGLRELEVLLSNTRLSSYFIKNEVKKFSLSNANSRLKRILFLTTLEDYLSTVSITEAIMETLEFLEELYRCDEYPVTSAMCAAYSAVAVDSTLKHLQMGIHDNHAYVDAVNRIWRCRVTCMNNSDTGETSLLFSPELEQWKRDIEASLSDSQLRERLASLHFRRNAFTKLRAFLDEEWAHVGLEVAGSSMQANETLTMNHFEAQQQEREIQNCSSAAADEDHLSTNIEVHKVGECGPLELQTLVRDSLLDSFRVNEEVLVENHSRDADVPCLDCINNNEADVMEIDQISLSQIPDHRSSVMEINTTACTSERDDPMDGLQDGTSDSDRLQLSCRNLRKRPPQKRDDPELSSSTKRRPNKMWSDLEKKTLTEAVGKIGRGKWKFILSSHKDIFVGRTEVDLKDKWRNMTRYEGN